MFDYFKGEIITLSTKNNNRCLLVLEVNQIGYEIQIPSCLFRELLTRQNAEKLENIEKITIYTHLQMREEKPILYGFVSNAERDLFRQLIDVNGVGTQTAVTLIDTLGIEDLVRSIVTADIRSLTKTPGVGQKTAERIALELKTKLSQWKQIVGVATSLNNPIPALAILEDLELTLLALGYTKNEIEQAVSILSQDSQLLKNTRLEEWLKRAITILSD
jgi:holliday junction DNA helicase RuvA